MDPMKGVWISFLGKSFVDALSPDADLRRRQLRAVNAFSLAALVSMVAGVLISIGLTGSEKPAWLWGVGAALGVAAFVVAVVAMVIMQRVTRIECARHPDGAAAKSSYMLSLGNSQDGYSMSLFHR